MRVGYGLNCRPSAGRVHEDQKLRFSAPLIRLLPNTDSPGHAGCLEPRVPRSLAFMRSGPARIHRKIAFLNSFNEFGLAEPILRALSEEKYVTPTPIQAKAIPLLLGGRDLIGIAQTGTGKTAAFALPILNRLAANRIRPERKTCRVLVLSPTRELSGQILDSFRTYGRHLRISIRARHRRRVDGRPGPRAAERRRRAGGHARPPARPGAEQRAAARQHRDVRARRSRPHARHGLHPRHPEDRRQAAEGAADAAVLGHHAAGHRRPRQADAEAIPPRSR